MIGKTIYHYKILKKLGEGGMGEVYLAEDTKLNRKAALKFLPSHLNEDEESKERFIREAQTAATLNHPNIVTIYEINEYEDQIYIAMEFVEGETLREKIKNRKQETENVYDFTHQICDGLAKAHNAGITHRDIKPENIIINKEGIVKILDFGLAKLKSDDNLTKGLSTIGTLKYISPEQYQNRNVDHRTDIWSLGVIMYEMTTGRCPFEGEYEAAVIYSIVNEEATPINSTDLEISANFISAIDRCLKKIPSERFESTSQIKELLNKPSDEVVKEYPTEKSIIVLPFENLSPDPDQEYFSDGLTEEIITDLSQIKSLKVISRSSAMTFKGSKKRIYEIAREVKAQYVLEGSVRKAGNNLRITAQLIDALEDIHLWAEKYSGTLKDIFDIQEKVSISIADNLRLKLFPEEVELIKSIPIRDLEAYDYYLRARDQIHKFDIDAINRTIEYLKLAQTIVGKNDVILSGLAYAYAHIVNLGLAQDEYIEKAEKYAQDALALNPNSSEALTVKGFFVLWFHGNSLQALNFLEHSCKLHPDDPNTLIWLAVAYAQIGKIEEARIVAARTIEVDPLTTMYYTVIGTVELYAGQFVQALKNMKIGLKGEPENPMMHVFFTIALFYCQRHDELRDFVSKNADIDRGTSVDILMILLAFSTEKKIKQMLSLFKNKEMLTTFRRDSQWSWFTASAFACAGDINSAIEWLENAVNRGFLNFKTISNFDPYLISVSNDARFERLILNIKTELRNL